MKNRKTEKRLDALWSLCQDWADRTKPTEASSIWQCDHFIEGAYDLMIEIAEIVGYRDESES